MFILLTCLCDYWKELWIGMFWSMVQDIGIIYDVGGSYFYSIAFLRSWIYLESLFSIVACCAKLSENVSLIAGERYTKNLLSFAFLPLLNRPVFKFLVTMYALHPCFLTDNFVLAADDDPVIDFFCLYFLAKLFTLAFSAFSIMRRICSFLRISRIERHGFKFEELLPSSVASWFYCPYLLLI